MMRFFIFVAFVMVFSSTYQRRLQEIPHFSFLPLSNPDESISKFIMRCVTYKSYTGKNDPRWSLTLVRPGAKYFIDLPVLKDNDGGMCYFAFNLIYRNSNVNNTLMDSLLSFTVNDKVVQKLSDIEKEMNRARNSGIVYKNSGDLPVVMNERLIRDYRVFGIKVRFTRRQLSFFLEHFSLRDMYGCNELNYVYQFT